MFTNYMRYRQDNKIDTIMQETILTRDVAEKLFPYQ